jgi:hypothetical protein
LKNLHKAHCAGLKAIELRYVALGVQEHGRSTDDDDDADDDDDDEQDDAAIMDQPEVNTALEVVSLDDVPFVDEKGNAETLLQPKRPAGVEYCWS